MALKKEPCRSQVPPNSPHPQVSQGQSLPHLPHLCSPASDLAVDMTKIWPHGFCSSAHGSWRPKGAAGPRPERIFTLIFWMRVGGLSAASARASGVVGPLQDSETGDRELVDVTAEVRGFGGKVEALEQCPIVSTKLLCKGMIEQMSGKKSWLYCFPLNLGFLNYKLGPQSTYLSCCEV